jgi:hypothetical protein
MAADLCLYTGIGPRLIFGYVGRRQRLLNGDYFCLDLAAFEERNRVAMVCDAAVGRFGERGAWADEIPSA